MSRKISVIGLGYVGLPVAVAFGKKSTVIGFDINLNRLSELRNGKDNTREVEQKDLKEAAKAAEANSVCSAMCGRREVHVLRDR